MRSIYRAYLLFAGVFLIAHFSISQLFPGLCRINSAGVLGVGFFSNSSLVLIGFLGIIALGYMAYHAKETLLRGLLLLTILSGLLNVADRVLHGGVCDYISIPIANLHINLNDVILTLNVLFITLMVIYGSKSGRSAAE
jgi:lipoprotein signal peptidase